MAAEMTLYGPQVPADLSGWSYEQFIAALAEVDNRSAWVKVRLIGAMRDEWVLKVAADTGMAHSTVLAYRALDKAYPAAEFSALNSSVRVAQALAAQPDRKELLARPEPWTGEQARQLVADREAKDPFHGTPPMGDGKKRRRGRPRKAHGKPPAATVPGTGEAVPPTVKTSPGAPSDAVALDLPASAHADQLAAEIVTLTQERETLASRVTWLEGKNEQLRKDLAETTALYEQASARAAELEPDNIRLRSELADALAAASQLAPGTVAEPVATVPAPDPEPQPESVSDPVPEPPPRRLASFEEMLAMGSLTGTCGLMKSGEKCGKPALPDPADIVSDDGKVTANGLLCGACEQFLISEHWTVTRP